MLIFFGDKIKIIFNLKRMRQKTNFMRIRYGIVWSIWCLYLLYLDLDFILPGFLLSFLA